MDRDTIIDGLRMTMDLFTFDPTTGEEKDPDDLNDLDRATYDACKGALEILERLDADSDTISRQAAIDIVVFECGKWTGLAKEICKQIKQLPTTQPERKKGKWIRNDNGTYSCSVCQSWIPEEQHCYARYCLYCGADMRGEQGG